MGASGRLKFTADHSPLPTLMNNPGYFVGDGGAVWQTNLVEVAKVVIGVAGGLSSYGLGLSSSSAVVGEGRAIVGQ